MTMFHAFAILLMLLSVEASGQGDDHKTVQNDGLKNDGLKNECEPVVENSECKLVGDQCWCKENPPPDDECPCHGENGCPFGWDSQYEARELCGYPAHYDGVYYNAAKEVADAFGMYYVDDNPSCATNRVTTFSYWGYTGELEPLGDNCPDLAWTPEEQWDSHSQCSVAVCCTAMVRCTNMEGNCCQNGKVLDSSQDCKSSSASAFNSGQCDLWLGYNETDCCVQPPTQPPCQDNEGWKDIWGNNCKHYAKTDGACDSFCLPQWQCASDACCACGGGYPNYAMDAPLEMGSMALQGSSYVSSYVPPTSVRTFVSAPTILVACAAALAGGGTVGMIVARWRRRDASAYSPLQG